MHSRRQALLPRSSLGSHLRSSLASSDRADQDLGGDIERLMQPADHCKRQGAIAAEDFVDPGPAADHADQRLSVSALLFEAELDGLDGIGRIDGEMSLLVSLNQRRQHLQAIASPVPSSAPQRRSISRRAAAWSASALIGLMVILHRPHIDLVVIRLAEVFDNRGNPSISCARDAMPARRFGDRAR